MPTDDALDFRVLVLAPVGRDAELTAQILTDVAIASHPCRDIEELLRELGRGAGGLLVAEEALSGRALEKLAAALQVQPPWSDVPLVVMATVATSPEAVKGTRDCVARLGHAVVLDRPVRIVSLVSSVRNALRSRRRQYEMRTLLRRLEDGVEQRDQFLAMLGHELRNPLTAIVYAARLLPEDTGRPREVIERQSRHLARLVDELLDVSRVTSGKIALKRKVVDLRELVARCVESLRPAAAALDLTVSLGEEALRADVDPVRFEQVVSNLLTNAIKYSSAGGHVSVTLRGDGSDALLAIEDDGVGIAANMLPHIFELFAQVDSTLDRARGGLGIGLTVVHALVELHGGSVRAYSEGLDRGSRFEVRLARADAATVDVVDDAEIPTSPQSTRRVLIVEDDADISEAMQDLLQAAGHSVETAANGPAGVERAKSSPPDVVLVDVGLPGMNGYDVARALRGSLGKRVFLAAVTGYGRPEDRARAREAGFDAHLTKPVDFESVERIVRRATRR